MDQEYVIVYLTSISEKNTATVDFAVECSKSLARKNTVVYWPLVWSHASIGDYFTGICRGIGKAIIEKFRKNPHLHLPWMTIRWPFFSNSFLIRINAHIIKFIAAPRRICLVCSCSSPDVLAVKRILRPVVTAIDRIDVWSTSEYELLHDSVDLIFSNAAIVYESQKGPPDKPLKIVPEGFVLRKAIMSLHARRKVESRCGKTVLYSGAITWRMNCRLLLTLMRHLPEFRFLFVGPMLFDADFNPAWIQLNERNKEVWKRMTVLPNFRYIPIRTQRDLIGMDIPADVGIIPYDIRSDFSRYSHPIKLYQYFALGIPVVSTPIPAITRFASRYIRFVRNPESFVSEIRRLSTIQIPAALREKYYSIALENTYERKADIMLSEFDRSPACHHYIASRTRRYGIAGGSRSEDNTVWQNS